MWDIKRSIWPMRGLDLDMSHFEDLDGFGRSPQDCYSWWFPNGWVMLGHFSHHFRGPFTDPSVFPTKGQRQSIGWVCPKMRFCSKHVNMLIYDNICTCHMFFHGKMKITQWNCWYSPFSDHLDVWILSFPVEFRRSGKFHQRIDVVFQ